MPINSLLNLITYNKKMLWLILLCNILGTLYGYIWYGGQLSVTDWQYKIFVPDSPTASLFLCIVFVTISLLDKLEIIDYEKILQDDIFEKIDKKIKANKV